MEPTKTGQTGQLKLRGALDKIIILSGTQVFQFYRGNWHGYVVVVVVVVVVVAVVVVVVVVV